MVLTSPSPHEYIEWIRSEKRFSISINQALSTLRPEEEKVIRLYYFFGLTDKKIGKKIGLSGTRANQIRLKALRKLRHPIRSKRLKSCIDYKPTIDSQGRKKNEG